MSSCAATLAWCLCAREWIVTEGEEIRDENGPTCHGPRATCRCGLPRGVTSNFRQAGLELAEAAGHFEASAVFQQHAVLARSHRLNFADAGEVYDDRAA